MLFSVCWVTMSVRNGRPASRHRAKLSDSLWGRTLQTRDRVFIPSSGTTYSVCRIRKPKAQFQKSPLVSCKRKICISAVTPAPARLLPSASSGVPSKNLEVILFFLQTQSLRSYTIRSTMSRTRISKPAGNN